MLLHVAAYTETSSFLKLTLLFKELISSICAKMMPNNTCSGVGSNEMLLLKCDMYNIRFIHDLSEEIVELDVPLYLIAVLLEIPHDKWVETLISINLNEYWDHEVKCAALKWAITLYCYGNSTDLDTNYIDEYHYTVNKDKTGQNPGNESEI